jgi:transposase
LYDCIKAVEWAPGRAPIDPKILMALWLYATIEGIGSARQIDALCREHDAFCWIAGDVSTNYHTLSDFRTGHVELLDKLLTDNVAVLIAEG